VANYRNTFESTVGKLLHEADVPFEYEPFSISLLEGFDSSLVSWERRGKVFSPSTSKIRAITYKPDFVGHGWIMETKGKRTQDFDLRWKLLKKKLTDIGANVTLYMPRSIKQAQACIKLIKDEYSKRDKDVFRIGSDLQLAIVKPAKPKVRKAKEDGANRRRRQKPL
jgi:hypothetical protein